MTELGTSIRRRRGRRRARARTAVGGRGKGPPGAARRSSRRFPRGLEGRPGRLALAVVLAALGGGALGHRFATTRLFPPGESPAALQGVPSLAGVSLAEAIAALADSGLAVERVDSVRHPVAPAGSVLGQRPLPGRSALPGSGVRVTVSVGPDTGVVPNVTRLAGERAVRVLEAGGFRVAVDTLESDRPAGEVLGLEPPPGAAVALPAVARLRLSRGPPTFPMPDLLGTSALEVRAAVAALGLDLAATDVRYSLLHVGRVFGQDPAPGEAVQRGAEVRVVVGRRLTRRALEAASDSASDPAARSAAPAAPTGPGP